MKIENLDKIVKDAKKEAEKESKADKKRREALEASRAEKRQAREAKLSSVITKAIDRNPHKPKAEKSYVAWQTLVDGISVGEWIDAARAAGLDVNPGYLASWERRGYIRLE